MSEGIDVSFYSLVGFVWLADMSTFVQKAIHAL